MAKIITAAEIQKGDLIRVTRDQTTEDRKASIVHEGVAAEFTFDEWCTANGWQLYANERNAVIELLDRPEPPLPSVPTLPHAVVKYTFAFDGTQRTAVRNKNGQWTCYDDGGAWRNERDGDEGFARMLQREDPNFQIVFEGVAK